MKLTITFLFILSCFITQGQNNDRLSPYSSYSTIDDFKNFPDSSYLGVVQCIEYSDAITHVEFEPFFAKDFLFEIDSIQIPVSYRRFIVLNYENQSLLYIDSLNRGTWPKQYEVRDLIIPLDEIRLDTVWNAESGQILLFDTIMTSTCRANLFFEILEKKNLLHTKNWFDDLNCKYPDFKLSVTRMDVPSWDYILVKELLLSWNEAVEIISNKNEDAWVLIEISVDAYKSELMPGIYLLIHYTP